METLLAHVRLDPPITGRAAIVQRQLTIDHVGNVVGALHGQTTHWIRLYVVLLQEVIVLARIALCKVERTIENEFPVVDEIDDVGGTRPAQQQGRGQL